MSWITQSAGSFTLKLSFEFSNVGLCGIDDWPVCGSCCALVTVKLEVKKMTAIVTAKVSVIVLDGETRISKGRLIMCREENTRSK